MPSQNAQGDGALHELLLHAEAELVSLIAFVLTLQFVTGPSSATVGWLTIRLRKNLQCDTPADTRKKCPMSVV
jgi:hypothetical protein